jgi:DNA-binding FrmR family transcriptional regulator
MEKHNMSKNAKERLEHRIKILKGQLRGLEDMILEDRYCPEIITQSLAIQKSLASLNKVLLENHLRVHLAHQLGSHNKAEIDQAVAEMLNLYELNNVRGSK